MMNGVAVFLLLVAYAHGQCSHTNPCTPLKGGHEFEPLKQVTSSNGNLATTLTVDVNSYTVDWLTVRRRLYNGGYTGPTIRIKAGDRVDLELINNLQEPDFVARMNELHRPNTTNLHTHGLHISSQEPQDNPFIRVSPQGSYIYHYAVHEHQPAGTYWYHPHAHGSVHFQLLSGMSGMLIVEDDPTAEENAAVSAVSCPDHCDRETQIVFQSFQYANDDDAAYAVFQRDIQDNEAFRFNDVQLDSGETLEDWLENPENDIRYILVNGQLQPRMEFAANQMRRFRFVNAIGVHALALSIEDPTGNKCEIKEIAIDGVYLPSPRAPRFGRSLVVAGGRLDWLVICEKPGNYALKSTFMESDFESMADHPTFNGVLAHIHVTGDVMPTGGLPSLPSFLGDLRSVGDDEIDGRFTVEVTPTDTLGREDFSGRHFRTKSRVNKIQEWNFINTEFETSHPIHMHINHMQVVSYNEYNGPVGVDDGEGNWKMYSTNGETCLYQHPLYDEKIDIDFPSGARHYLGHSTRYEAGEPGTFGYAQVGEWRDTLLVPPLSNITVRFRTDSFSGDVVIHCHLTGDEDQGMMMVTQIVEEGESLAANELSGDAAPGSCLKEGATDRKMTRLMRMRKFFKNLKNTLMNKD